MLCSDAIVPATLSLAASRLPAADLSQAFRVLTVALVPASWLILASASFAKASPWARSPRSGQTAVSVSTVEGAHGSCNSQGKSSGRMLVAFSSGAFKTRTRRLLASLSSSREQGRETNGLISAPGTRTPSAARQTIVFSRTRPRDKRFHSTRWEQEPRAPLTKRSKARADPRSVPIRIIQILLGHSSLRSTEIYTHLTDPLRDQLRHLLCQTTDGLFEGRRPSHG